MAQAGTTTNLRQGPATGFGRQAGLWMVVIAAAVVLAIAIAIGMTQVSAPKSTSGSLAGYEQIEAQRGAAGPWTVDRSYDQIEAQRGATQPAPVLLDRGADRGAVSSERATGDSYDAQRAAAFAATVATPSVDHSKDHYKHAIGKGPLQ